MHAENSEVLPGLSGGGTVAGLVAVAVIDCPTDAEAPERVMLNVTLFPMVVTFAVPRNVRPSPLPDESQDGFEKKSKLNVVLAVLLSVPWMFTPPPAAPLAEVRTGKFCRLFAPVSTSLRSFAVTPAGERSIPSPAFEKIEFERIALLVPLSIRTPEPRLPAIMLASAATPPIRLLLAELITATPSPPLGTNVTPSARVPILLP